MMVGMVTIGFTSSGACAGVRNLCLDDRSSDNDRGNNKKGNMSLVNTFPVTDPDGGMFS
jgi:hypothetical protein